MKGPYVTKEFQFDAAHMLTGHAGLCKNLHGHTYKVEVTLAEDKKVADLRSKETIGMVVDFKELKEHLNANLFGYLDHAYIYNSFGGQMENSIAGLLQSEGMRTYDLGYRPTAENMAKEFFETIRVIIKGFSVNVKLIRVKVWETPTSYAEVSK